MNSLQVVSVILVIITGYEQESHSVVRLRLQLKKPATDIVV